MGFHITGGCCGGIEGAEIDDGDECCFCWANQPFNGGVGETTRVGGAHSLYKELADDLAVRWGNRTSWA